jgi:uncharacterized protein YndB with AHSA1/START domain
MNLNLIAKQSILIDVKQEHLWHVLTEPAIIKEYLFGTETITDWKIGSDIVFQGEYNGHKYRDHGKILNLIPNELIEYTYWSSFSGLEDKPENYGKVKYTISKKGDACELTWYQIGFADEEKQKHSQNSLIDFLKNIKAIAERK